MPIADGFDSPVGTAAERRGTQIWPGTWFDATGYATYYEAVGAAYHTGADLNDNGPAWDADRDAPVYACANGVVTWSGRFETGTWGNLIVVRHDPLPGGQAVWSRYAHLGIRLVATGDRVARGQQIATIGNAAGRVAYHLHFDIAVTDVLEDRPGDWPGMDRARLVANYTDPQAFIRAHRPGADADTEEDDMADVTAARALITKALAAQMEATEAMDAAAAALEGNGSAPPAEVLEVVNLGAKTLTVRSGPGTGYAPVGALALGMRVTAIEWSGDWVHHDRGGWSAQTYGGVTYLRPI